MTIGPFWCQEQQTWLRFQITEQGAYAEMLSSSTKWQRVPPGVWSVYDYEGNEENPTLSFFALQDGQLYKTDGRISLTTQVFHLSQFKVTEGDFLPINTHRFNPFAGHENVLAQTPGPSPYRNLPWTPEKLQKEWQKFQENDNWLNVRLDSKSFFNEAQQNLLQSTMESRLIGLKDEYKSHEDYLSALHQVIEDENNKYHQQLVELASCTDVHDETAFSELREQPEELMPAKLNFFLDIIREKIRSLSNWPNIHPSSQDENRNNDAQETKHFIEDNPGQQQHEPPIVQEIPTINTPNLHLQTPPSTPNPGLQQQPPVAQVDTCREDTNLKAQPLTNNSNSGTQVEPQHTLTSQGQNDKPDPLAPIKQAVAEAQSKYQRWFSNEEKDLRGPNGFFSWLRHGKTGQQRALKIRDTITNCDDMTQSIDMLNDFLRQKSTRYHRHSFASFLLDELVKLQGTPWQDIKPSNLYDSRKVTEELNQKEKQAIWKSMQQQQR